MIQAFSHYYVLPSQSGKPSTIVDERDVLAEGKPPAKDEATALLAARSARGAGTVSALRRPSAGKPATY